MGRKGRDGVLEGLSGVERTLRCTVRYPVTVENLCLRVATPAVPGEEPTHVKNSDTGRPSRRTHSRTPQDD